MSVLRVYIDTSVFGGYFDAEFAESSHRFFDAVFKQSYLQSGVVTPKYADDALHVAQATLARGDVIVSWNFKHLVNPTRIRKFNGVNLMQSYGLVVIMTPSEIVKLAEETNEQAE